MATTYTTFTEEEMHRVAVVLEDAVADMEQDGLDSDEMDGLPNLMQKAWQIHAEMKGEA